MIDSHSHIYCEAFDDDRDQVMQRALEAGVTHIVLPNENAASVPRLLDMKARYPGRVHVALGLHPEEVRADWRETLAGLEPLLDRHRWVAVGEVGMDLYWDKTYRHEQQQALERQLGWCADRGLPFIMHCREALDEVLEVLAAFDGQMPRGVFHCFTSTAAEVDRIRRLGDFYFGIGGVLTFKKSRLGEVLPTIGLERILLETDAPYMAPVPHRGQRNESAFVAEVAHAVAGRLGIDTERVRQATTDNAMRLFGLERQTSDS